MSDLAAALHNIDDDTQHDAVTASVAMLIKQREEWRALAMLYLREIQDLRAILGRVHKATEPREELPPLEQISEQ